MGEKAKIAFLMLVFPKPMPTSERLINPSQKRERKKKKKKKIEIKGIKEGFAEGPARDV